MNGSNRKAGAVAGLTNIKNPIDAAIAVMEYSPHVFLIGKGAESFSISQGLDTVPQSYFYTERLYQEHLDELNRKPKSLERLVL